MRLRPLCLGARAVRLNTAKLQALNKRCPCCFTFQACLSCLKIENQDRMNPLYFRKHNFAVLKVDAHTLTTVWLKHTSYAPMQITRPYFVSTFPLKQRATKLNFQTGENKLIKTKESQLISQSPSPWRTWEAGRANSPASLHQGPTNSDRELRRRQPHLLPPIAPSHGRFRLLS